MLAFPDSAVSFRVAVRADRPALDRFCAAYRAADGHPPRPDLVAVALDALFAGNPFVRVWMIEAHGASVGYVAIALGFSIEVGGIDAFLDEIYVDEAARGRGLGTRAIAFAEEECRKLGVRRLNLEVERRNVRAKALYERVGFRSHDRFLMSKLL